MGLLPPFCHHEGSWTEDETHTVREEKAERIPEIWGHRPWSKPSLMPTLILASTYVRTDFPVVWYLHGGRFL